MSLIGKINLEDIILPIGKIAIWKMGFGKKRSGGEALACPLDRAVQRQIPMFASDFIGFHTKCEKIENSWFFRRSLYFWSWKLIFSGFVVLSSTKS